MARYVFYIHGFASSARSTKAAFFAERLRPHGIELRCPDFNQPDFSSLTLSRMLGQLEDELAGLAPGPVALIGSSMGGQVAFHAAVRQAIAGRGTGAGRAWIDRMVLLAPALDFGHGRMGDLDAAAMERWKATDRLDVFHYGDNVMRPLRYALIEDAHRYDSFSVRADVPTLIFQGLADEAVDPAMVRRFSAGRSHVTLRLVPDDHLLMTSLDLIARETLTFLGVPQG